MTDSILDGLPIHVDLTDPSQLSLIDEKVEEVLSRYPSEEDLAALELELLSGEGQQPVLALLVLKLARSRLKVQSIGERVTLSIVLAVYNEHTRIKTSDEHPHGEDFLRQKVAQLETLFGDNPNVSWKLIVVDDGCPEESGRIAQNIIDSEGLGSHAEVVFLKDAIEQGAPVTRALSTTVDSQKGGSVLLGMWHAAASPSQGRHIVIYTDADLSTHLGQTGLLIEPILNESAEVAIASRREPESVVVKQGTRNDRGKLFIYLWKRLLPILGEIIDTQCGFKAFKQEVLLDILDDLLEYRFAFDIELLLRASLQAPGGIAKVPIAWIDSEAASTTTDLQPYLPMLKSIARMYRTYLPPDPAREEFADFITDLDEEGFNRLVSNIPEAIVGREPFEFADFDGVTVDDLRACSA